jgi:ABC-type transport system involved in multi-copper enzyme maturation permease subunit
MTAIVGYAMREALRRRVFVVVLLLTVAFLALYLLGAAQAFHESEDFAGSQFGVDDHVLVGSTVFGLSMFAILFLGSVLGIFLTLSVVRGDAERGLLQPLVVRPIGRAQLLLARLAGAAGVTALYVAAVYLLAALGTWLVGDWAPDRLIGPMLGLCGAAVVLTALSLLGSTLLTGTANGIAAFMVYGAGLTGGLLGQIGEGIGSPTLEKISDVVGWVLPFEALYQDALHGIAADAAGFTDFAVELGPFGGADQGGALLYAWAAVYLALVAAAAVAVFRRRDL